MRDHNAIRIPNFLEKPAPPAYSATGLAARAIYLQKVAVAWQKVGDENTAAKIQRDAEDAAKRSALLIEQAQTSPVA